MSSKRRWRLRLEGDTPRVTEAMALNPLHDASEDEIDDLLAILDEPLEGRVVVHRALRRLGGQW